MSVLARAYPADYEDWLDELAGHADRCPHGEDDWNSCDVCLEDERETRIWERRSEQ